MAFRFDEAAKLLTAEEVAERYRVKAATIYQAAAEGRIPCVRLWEGSRRALVRFRESDIEGLIVDRTFLGSAKLDAERATDGD